MILNLTQHKATAEQIAAGVVEPAPFSKGLITDALTFASAPTSAEMRERAEALAWLADESGCAVAMLGGAPFFMPYLERALTDLGIRPMYAFSVRETTEVAQDDGSVRKTAVFRHAGFVEGLAWERREALDTRHHEGVTGLAADCDPAEYAS